MERGSALDYLRVDSLATVQRIDRATWDALEQYIVLEVSLGKTLEQSTQVFVNLTPPAALQLLLELQQCLSDKDPEERPVQ